MIVAALWLCGSVAQADPTDQAPADEAGVPEVGTPGVAADAASDEAQLPEAVSPLPEGFVPDSSYGHRVSPRTGRRTFHAGADFLAPRGTPVHAVRAGVVERVTNDTTGRTRFRGYGRAIVIHHADVERWSFYAHLDSVDVVVGQVVEAGEPIGTVGNSSNRRFHGMPTHLHLEVRHARPGGRSPFPGPYRRHNQDPVDWLHSMGVRFVRARPSVQPS